MTLRDWLAMANTIEALSTRAERVAHAERVRLAIGDHTERRIRWNLYVCDSLDISIALTPEACDPKPSPGDTHILELHNEATGCWHDRGYYPSAASAEDAKAALVAEGYEARSLRVREVGADT